MARANVSVDNDSLEDYLVVIDEKLLHATVKLNTILFAGICGLMAGVALLLVTYLALYRDSSGQGNLLNLLGAFFPGYDVTPLGAWIGFGWAGILGAALGGLLYRMYARNIRERVAEYCRGARDARSLEYLVLRFNGHTLGLAFGTTAGAFLFSTTNWLAATGSAWEISRAALLSHFLPGYSVSLAGSLIGAGEACVICYLACRILGAVYNGIVSRRHGDRAL